MKKYLFLFFSIALLAASCKKDDTATGETATPDYFSASLTLDNLYDFETGDLTAHASMIHIHDSVAIDTVDIDYLAFFDNQFIDDDQGQHVGRIMVGLSGFSYKKSEYVNGALPFNESILNVGTAYYVDDTEIPGPEVVFVDQNATHWSSRYGNQLGSTFTITQNVQGKTSDRRYLKGTFSCKVYNEFDPSQFKTITNGEFDVFLPKAEL